MGTQAQTATAPKSEAVVAQKIQKLKELYADAPELGKAALKNGLANIEQELAAISTTAGKQSAGRAGARRGKVSELTAILKISKDGAKRLRGLLEIMEGNFKGADIVG